MLGNLQQKFSSIAVFFVHRKLPLDTRSILGCDRKAHDAVPCVDNVHNMVYYDATRTSRSYHGEKTKYVKANLSHFLIIPSPFVVYKMAWAWQLWLSPRPQHRTKIGSQATFTTAGDAARFEFFTEDDGRWAVRETHYIDNPIVRAGKAGPPL